MKNTERFINNWDFFDGFAGEAEFELYIKEKPEYHIHIWDGYLSDIVGKPRLDGMGWHGFTKDYHEIVRTGEWDEYEIEDIDEYINDLLEYKDRVLGLDGTDEAYQLILDFLLYAKENNLTVVGMTD